MIKKSLLYSSLAFVFVIVLLLSYILFLAISCPRFTQEECPIRRGCITYCAPSSCTPDGICTMDCGGGGCKSPLGSFKEFKETFIFLVDIRVFPNLQFREFMDFEKYPR